MGRKAIYAATSGQCLVRDTAEVDEQERRRVLRDFQAGIRFIIDPSRHEVRGFLPVRRSSPEKFFGVVHFETNTNPIELYWNQVSEEFKKHPDWTLRDDTEEGRFLRIIAGEMDRDIETTECINMSTLHNSPTIISVSSLEIAGHLLKREFENGGSNKRLTIVVSVKNPSHVDYDVLYWRRSQDETVKLVEQSKVDENSERASDSTSNRSLLVQMLPRWIRRRIY